MGALQVQTLVHTRPHAHASLDPRLCERLAVVRRLQYHPGIAGTWQRPAGVSNGVHTQLHYSAVVHRAQSIGASLLRMHAKWYCHSNGCLPAATIHAHAYARVMHLCQQLCCKTRSCAVGYHRFPAINVFCDPLKPSYVISFLNEKSSPCTRRSTLLQRS